MKKIISAQLVLAIAVLLGLSSTAIAGKSFQTTYKAEKCDCMGFSDNIPTFLSDLNGAQGIDIYGEGKTLKAAQKKAQNMCVETYRNFASVKETDKKVQVSQTGCHMFKSTKDGDWVSI